MQLYTVDNTCEDPVVSTTQFRTTRTIPNTVPKRTRHLWPIEAWETLAGHWFLRTLISNHFLWQSHIGLTRIKKKEEKRLNLLSPCTVSFELSLTVQFDLARLSLHCIIRVPLTVQFDWTLQCRFWRLNNFRRHYSFWLVHCCKMKSFLLKEF